MRLSRAEWALAAGVVLLVVSLVVPLAVWQLHRQSRLMVRRDMQALLEAGQAFYSEYGIWPSPQLMKTGDARYGTPAHPNRLVLAILRSVEPESSHDMLNPHRLVFIDVPDARAGSSGLDAAGDFRDPWGMPYQIVLDADLNAVCDIPDSLHGAGISQSMLVWSCGPDRISDTADDILSW